MYLPSSSLPGVVLNGDGRGVVLNGGTRGKMVDPLKNGGRTLPISLFSVVSSKNCGAALVRNGGTLGRMVEMGGKLNGASVLSAGFVVRTVVSVARSFAVVSVLRSSLLNPKLK